MVAMLRWGSRGCVPVPWPGPSAGCNPCNTLCILSESLQSSLRGQGRGRVAELISQHFESFTPSERQIADRLLGDPVTNGFATATELAKELGISASTVV